MYLPIPLKLLLTSCVFVLAASHSVPGVFAQVEAGTLAFVRPNDETGDEIWLIEADGSNERRIWATDVADPSGVYTISDIDWRPDGSTLAFAGNHESACSIFDSDIFAIEADGSGYRRLTNAPACAELAGYAQGSVTVDVYNATTGGPFFVYVQGSPELQMVLVPQWSTVRVAFDHVADLGEVMQQAVVIEGMPDWRNIAPIAAADVEPGQTVYAGQINVTGDGLENFGAYVPSWHSDGTRLGFIFGDCASLYGIDAVPVDGMGGEALLDDENGYVFPCVVDSGPTPATANQLLYYSYLNNGIYQVTEGSNESGTQLVATLGYEIVYDLQWQPDGSGFLFTKLGFDDNFVYSANIFAYSLASGVTTQLTDFRDEYARNVTMSSDGQLIVFERSPTQEFDAIDLYAMNRDGSGMRLLVEDGRLPSWRGGVAEASGQGRLQMGWQAYLDGVSGFIARVQHLWDRVLESAPRNLP